MPETPTTNISVFMDGSNWSGLVLGEAPDVELSMVQAIKDQKLFAYFDLADTTGRIYFNMTKVNGWSIEGDLPEEPGRSD